MQVIIGVVLAEEESDTIRTRLVVYFLKTVLTELSHSSKRAVETKNLLILGEVEVGAGVVRHTKVSHRHFGEVISELSALGSLRR